LRCARQRARCQPRDFWKRFAKATQAPFAGDHGKHRSLIQPFSSDESFKQQKVFMAPHDQRPVGTAILDGIAVRAMLVGRNLKDGIRVNV
jgi:hypothetical protein